MENIIIPKSLQITMDDVGWFNGSDDRENGGSARTAMTRRHCHEDYLAINELGKRLNMRINCAFILGEWDPDNRLADVPYLSKYGKDWDNARNYDLCLNSGRLGIDSCVNIIVDMYKNSK